jgi:nucleoside-diphosphate-sugar epimerase
VAPARVLVTGANGFVGRALCRHLLTMGMAVRGAVRDAQVPLPEGVERVLVGDLGPETEWRQALDRTAGVVHLAARVHLMQDDATDPLAAYRQVNTAGTLNLAREAAAAGVRRFVFLSSIKVNGEGRDQPYSESDPPAPADPYGQSKWEAEQGLRQIAAQTGLEVAILRPPLVYGPGVGANFLRLIRWVHGGAPLPLAAVRNRRSLVYVENLASAIAACLSAPAAAGKTFLVADGAPVSTAELVAALARALGVADRSWPLPPAILRLAGKLTGRSVEVGRLLDSLALDDSALRQELDWRPPCTMDEGLRLTAEWFRNLR